MAPRHVYCLSLLLLTTVGCRTWSGGSSPYQQPTPPMMGGLAARASRPSPILLADARAEAPAGPVAKGPSLQIESPPAPPSVKPPPPPAPTPPPAVATPPVVPAPPLPIASPPQVPDAEKKPAPAIPVSRPAASGPALDSIPASSSTPAPRPAPTISSVPAPNPAPNQVSSSVTEASSADTVVVLRNLHRKATQTYAKMDTYVMRLRRREVVNGKARPVELILAKFRKEPFSVYLKWLGEEAKGREVAFVKGRYEGMIHTLMAPGDLFLFAGKVFKVAPDSSLVKSSSRYPITEAGMGPLLERFDRLVTAVETGDSRQGTVKYLGLKKRPEFEQPVESLMQTLPPKGDPLLPNGGRRWWSFDPQSGLPVLVATHDEQGREVEYYCHDRFQYPAALDEDDFNPNTLWKGYAKGK